MRNVRKMIFTAIAMVSLMGLTTGTGYSAGSRVYPGEPVSSSGSATGGITETSRTPGIGAHTTIKRELTVEKVSPESMGTGTGGTMGIGTGGTVDQDTGGTMDRGTGGTIDRGTGGTMDRGTGGTIDRGTGGTMDRDTGGTIDRGTGGTMDKDTGGNGATGTGGEK